MTAIATAAFSDASVRNWLIQGTRFETAYRDAISLHELQAAIRPGTKSPFYENYWCGKDTRCACKVEGSRAIETDMMIFLENSGGRRLGIHIEMKRDGEALSPGQAETYPRRAACWASPATRPRRVLPHHEWMTAIFCGDREIGSPALSPFMRQIGHSEAGRILPEYPA
ncbi:hypothetical protein [Maritimibacter alkaliphilus]|uniref:hypothetical protein n=1 Tax=Maritimibacter alkaliphilus TaxID=404236 RepID=UPI0011E649FE|nr:hypothetical protein [Maritimibacter alkaliphilus]